uniref:Poly [ADP-ribose] polymerase n=1 Tax=Crassostrea virginica TaxID=6565 RepID=A0A8B8CZJ8_CRAVI|nr:uncharacterized protein LOC111123137 isoform X2 [Crassostrea virginica]
MAEYRDTSERYCRSPSRPSGPAVRNGHPGSMQQHSSYRDDEDSSQMIALSKICRDEEDLRLLARLLKCGKGREVVSELEDRYNCQIHIKYKTTPKRRMARRRSQPQAEPPHVPTRNSMPFPIRLFGSKKTADSSDYKSTSSTINNVEVKVKQGDITKEKVGGNPLIKALKDAKSKLGSCRVISTVGGNLKCQFVFTIILNPWNDVASQQAFPQILDECFQLCIQSGFTSISLPMLGCGRMLQYPLQTSADTMMQVANKAISQGGLQAVTFVAYSPPEYDAMTRALSQVSRGAPGGATAAPSNEDDEDGNVISCSMSVSRRNVIANVLSDMEDRLLATEHISNPNNKCLPLRTKGRIHEMASKKGRRHIRLEIDQKTGNIELKGERDHIKACKREIIPLLIGVVNTSDRLKCSSEFWSSLAHEYTQTPPYWSHYPLCRPMPEVFRLFQANRQPMLVPVDKTTDAAVRSLVFSTWEPQSVGQGRDAVGLSHTSIKIHNVERIENLELFAKYAIKRQEFFRALADDETYEFPRLEDLPVQCRGEIETSANLPALLKEELFPEINEHYMFHGTKPDVLQTIIHQGLDFRMSSDKAMFGMGIYGAESSTKADQYVDAKTNRTPGVKKMLLMRMLLGKSYVCLDPNPRKYRRPPCTSSGCRRDDCVDMHDRFDSVVGDGQWLFREFVVYAVDQCYPEFIISYERV